MDLTEESKLKVAITALEIIEKAWFDPIKNPHSACIGCDVNMDDSEKHSKECPIDIAHRTLEFIQ